MDSNIIKFTSITEGESSYSIELSMPFIGISVDENNRPVSQLTYQCDISVMKGTSKLLPSNAASTGTYKIQLITSSISGLKNISADNVNGRVSFTTDVQNVLSNGDIEFQILLEDVGNAVTKTIGFTALQGLQGSDGLTYSFDYDNGSLVKFKNGSLYEYTPKIFRIAAYRRQGIDAREKLTNTDCNLTATITVNSTENPIPVSWDNTNQVFFISFEDSTKITVNGNTDYITQFNIRRLDINIYDTDNVLIEHLGIDVNYGTSDDAASLVLNPTSIIGAIQNTKIGFTSEGLDIFRGGLRIFQGTNNSSEKVFEADQNGNLRVRGSIVNGSAMAGWAIREHTMVSGSGLVGIGDGNAYSPAGDYSFWAGNENPEEAPFSVKKTGEMKATLLEIGGTQITQGTIRTGAFAPGAVNHTALGENAVDSVNIRQGAVITDHLYANSVTVDKLAADVGQSLDLSSNQSIALMAGDLRDEIQYAQENAYGQSMTITFKNGNAFEYGKSNIVISVHVWRNGNEITDTIPNGAFLWQRDSGNTSSDNTWNAQSSHRYTKSIILPRDEIGASCVIRCICDEERIYPIVSHTSNGIVYFTTVDGGVDDTFSLQDGNLYTTGSNYELKDGYLYTNTYSDYMQVESTAFDHSMLLSSHILIKDEKIDISSGGNINLLAGADLNVQATADINVAANGNINISNKGHLNVASGGDIIINSGGKLRVSASDIQFTASKTLDDTLSDLDDDISGLDSRLGTAELKITPSAIVSTVRSNTSYQSDLSSATSSANTYTDNKLLSYSTTTNVQSMISQSAESIQQSVAQTYATISYTQSAISGVGQSAQNYTNERLSLYSTTAQMNSAITQSANSITSSVSQTYATKTYADNSGSNALSSAKTYTDGKLTSYSTTTEMNSAIDQKADGITAAVSETYATKTQVQNISIGGRNLLLKSDTEYNNNNYLIASYTPSSPLTAGQEYTISVCITPASKVQYIQPIMSGGYSSQCTLTVTGTSKQIVSASFTAKYYSGRTPTDNPSYANISIYRFPNDGTVTTKSTIHWVKVEKGNKATDWTPAPEDTEGDVTDLQTRMSSAEAKITPTAIVATVSESGSFYSKQSSISITSSGITLKGGDITIQSGANFVVSAGGVVKIDAGNGVDSYISLGAGNFSASKDGGVVATSGNFQSLKVGGSDVLTADKLNYKIVVSSTQPSNEGVIWFCPTSVKSVQYSASTGSNRNINLHNNTRTLSIKSETNETMPNSTFTYEVRVPVYLINDGSRETNVRFTITATKATNSSLSITFPTYTLASIGEWQQKDITVSLTSSVNLCATTGDINIGITTGGVNSYNLYVQRYETISLKCTNTKASGTVQACSVYYIP